MPTKKKTTKDTVATPVKSKKIKNPEKVSEGILSEPEVVETTMIEVESMAAPASVRRKKSKKPYIIVVAVIIIIIILSYVFRSQFIAATVNGQPISRAAYDTELQKEAGKKSMNALVTKMLILQEANKEHVSVSDTEVANQIKSIQKQLSGQGQSLDSALKTQGLTMDDLKEQIRVEQLIEKMLAKNIQVSDKEVDDYIQKAQQANANSETGSPTPALSKDTVRQQLKQEKLSTQFTPWLQKLQAKANIKYFIPQDSTMPTQNETP